MSDETNEPSSSTPPAPPPPVSPEEFETELIQASETPGILPRVPIVPMAIPAPPAAPEVPAIPPRVPIVPMPISTPTAEEPAKRKSFGRLVPRFRRRWVSIALLSLLGMLLLGAAGVSYAGYRYGEKYEGRILPGTTIAGVDVGGMAEDTAIEAVRDALGPQLDREITIVYSDESWIVTPRELGAKSDARSAVRAALNASDSASLLKLTQMSVLGDDLGFEREIAITYPNQGVRGFMRGLAENFDREPRDESIDYSSGWIKFKEPRDGRELKQKASRQALIAALHEDDDTVMLEVESTEPKTTDKYDQVLLVRKGENKLYLYEDGKITHEWLVATGLAEYPTPVGEFEVELKRYLPTWVNPAPDTWGADLPDMIPPGPGNPLGLRAINWTSPAIRFHGTSAVYSLGYNASHGCVRMANEDVIELYDLIDIGTPIISVETGLYRPLYGSSTIVDTETTEETETEDSPEPEGNEEGNGGND